MAAYQASGMPYGAGRSHRLRRKTRELACFIEVKGICALDIGRSVTIGAMPEVYSRLTEPAKPRSTGPADEGELMNGPSCPAPIPST